MIVFAALIQLITLHQIDGRTVEINPHAVSRLIEPRNEKDPKKQFDKKVNCLVWFDDSYFGVAETCAEVRALIESAK